MERQQGNGILPFSFEEAYHILKQKGPAKITSIAGKVFTLDAYSMVSGKGQATSVIRVNPRNGSEYIRYAYIHADCWGDERTCQGARVEEIYNSPSNIYSWLDTMKRGM